MYSSDSLKRWKLDFGNLKIDQNLKSTKPWIGMFMYLLTTLIDLTNFGNKYPPFYFDLKKMIPKLLHVSLKSLRFMAQSSIRRHPSIDRSIVDIVAELISSTLLPFIYQSTCLKPGRLKVSHGIFRNRNDDFKPK